MDGIHNINQTGSTNAANFSKQENIQKPDKQKMNQSIFSGDKDGDGRISRNDFKNYDARAWNSIVARGLSGKSWSGLGQMVEDLVAQFEKKNTETGSKEPIQTDMPENTDA